MKYFVIISATSAYGAELLRKPDCLMAGPHPVLVGIELHTDGMHYVSLVLDPEPRPGDPTAQDRQRPQRIETYIPHNAVVAIQAGGDAETTKAFGFA
jgi:hypothetical protein